VGVGRLLFEFSSWSPTNMFAPRANAQMGPKPPCSCDRVRNPAPITYRQSNNVARRAAILQSRIGNQAALRFLAGVADTAQPKLAVGQANDPFEREAHRIAELVLRMPDADQGPAGDSRPRPIDQKKQAEQQAPALACAAPQRESIRRQEDDIQAPEGEDETVEDVDGTMLSRAESPGAGEIKSVPARAQARLLATRGHGQALAPSLRNFFEPRLGYDLSQVRVHTDHGAAELSDELRAKAFTVGQDIYFGRGQFRTYPEGLLAHELVHTLQSREGAGLLRRQPDDLPEPPMPADKPPVVPQTPCPTSVALGSVTHRNHGDLPQEEQEKFRTYLSAKATMNVGPGPDHSGHCMKEKLTSVSSDCPAKVYTRTNKAGEVTESAPCSASICLDIDRFGSGKTAFIDEHRTRVPESVLEGTGKTSCTVVCEQVYTCDRQQPTTGKFQITRKYQASTAKRADGTDMHVTTGRVEKTTAP
jgi:hypothetical protein